MSKQNQFITHHLSIRVPWHDDGWNGTVCKDPVANSACLVLETCAKKKQEALEALVAGKSFDTLADEQLPPCLAERVSFMAPFGLHRTLRHPYVEIAPDSHGQLEPTIVHFPKFSAASIPYRWMRKENADFFAGQNELDYDATREPVLPWEKNGANGGLVQEYHNQKAMLNGFFDHIEEQNSLVFFYAKQVPFYEGNGRVLVGVGRVEQVIES
ncbi:MAG: RNA helicase, partial [Proteobacteria bacterium]